MYWPHSYQGLKHHLMKTPRSSAIGCSNMVLKIHSSINTFRSTSIPSTAADITHLQPVPTPCTKSTATCITYTHWDKDRDPCGLVSTGWISKWFPRHNKSSTTSVPHAVQRYTNSKRKQPALQPLFYRATKSLGGLLLTHMHSARSTHSSMTEQPAS